MGCRRFVSRRAFLAAGPPASLARRGLHGLDLETLAARDPPGPPARLRSAALLSSRETSGRRRGGVRTRGPGGARPFPRRDRAPLRGGAGAAAPRPRPFSVARGVFPATASLLLGSAGLRGPGAARLASLPARRPGRSRQWRALGDRPDDRGARLDALPRALRRRVAAGSNVRSTAPPAGGGAGSGPRAVSALAAGPRGA